MSDRTCSVEGCTYTGRIIIEWCDRHYRRQKKYGDPLGGGKFQEPQPAFCVVDGCDKPPRSQSMCSGHLNRSLRYGDPIYAPPLVGLINCCAHGCRPNAATSFWARVSGESYQDCWNWTGGLNKKGYGRFSPAGKGWRVLAHRWAYEHVIGEIPDGLELDHLCRNHRCINPWHLEPVTHLENVRRANVA